MTQLHCDYIQGYHFSKPLPKTEFIDFIEKHLQYKRFRKSSYGTVSYFLYFDVDPANIDVNIHPTKTEIKFENEQAIWQILSAAIKETLGRFNAVPTIDFDTEGMPDIPAFENSPYSGLQMPKPTFNPEYNPFDSTPSSYSRKETRGWDKLYEGLEPSAPASFAATKVPGFTLPSFPGGVTIIICSTPATFAGIIFISTDDGYAAFPPGT